MAYDHSPRFSLVVTKCNCMKTLVSIIIPVYNVAPYLRECLDSVLAQKFGDWEAICVDDGSTDGSSAILDEYALNDKRFRIIHQKNAGVSATRNVALDLAIGEWLAFVDADDLLPVDSLAHLLSMAKDVDAKVVIGTVVRFGNGHEVTVGPAEDGQYSPEDLYVKYNSLCAWSCGKIYKRSLWDGVRFPVGIAYSEDRYILHKFLYRFPRVPVVANPVYRYRRRADSAYGAAWKPAMLQCRYALIEQIDFFKENGFVRAELYTVGLYYKWIGSGVTNLVKMSHVDLVLLESIKKETCFLDNEYWGQFVRMVKKERWEEFLPCGEIRTLVDGVLNQKGKVSMIKRAMNIVQYDGMAVLWKMFAGKVLRRVLKERT